MPDCLLRSLSEQFRFELVLLAERSLLEFLSTVDLRQEYQHRELLGWARQVLRRPECDKARMSIYRASELDLHFLCLNLGGEDWVHSMVDRPSMADVAQCLREKVRDSVPPLTAGWGWRCRVEVERVLQSRRPALWLSRMLKPYGLRAELVGTGNLLSLGCAESPGSDDRRWASNLYAQRCMEHYEDLDFFVIYRLVELECLIVIFELTWSWVRVCQSSPSLEVLAGYLRHHLEPFDGGQGQDDWSDLERLLASR